LHVFSGPLGLKWAFIGGEQNGGRGAAIFTPNELAVIIIIINVKINVALSENASKTRYTIKIKLKLRK